MTVHRKVGLQTIICSNVWGGSKALRLLEVAEERVPRPVWKRLSIRHPWMGQEITDHPVCPRASTARDQSKSQNAGWDGLLTGFKLFDVRTDVYDAVDSGGTSKNFTLSLFEHTVGRVDLRYSSDGPVDCSPKGQQAIANICDIGADECGLMLNIRPISKIGVILSESAVEVQ